MPSGSEEKAALRARFRAARAALADEEYTRRSTAICRRIETLPEWQAARTVHLYWPLTKRREVDTRSLLDALTAEGRRAALPVVLPGAAPRLAHRLYEGRAALRLGRFGIPEPTGTPAVASEEMDLAVVPAFGAGCNGHRIGHGAGYYDAFLAGLSVPTVCPVYHACLVRAVPAEAHDVPVSIIVTERTTLRIAAPA